MSMFEMDEEWPASNHQEGQEQAEIPNITIFIGDKITDRENRAEQIRMIGRREVFRMFVVPFCNEMLQYDNTDSDLSDWKEDVFRYLYAVQKYILDGKYDGSISDSDEWKRIKARIDLLIGK